ncbi:hypothetical protein GGR53DRAFT_524055 [Hypoxylon sp. FL1150]|nr:hypothetical protein GGR53DRAFT_524055 [Hypoxylon sp. FL1150]
MDSHISYDAEDATTKSAASRELLQLARSLQSELERFARHLTEMYDGYFQHMPAYVYTSFASELRAEVDSLEKAMQSTDPLSSHRMQSSNLPFLMPIWDISKRSHDIVRLRCPVSTGPFKKQILAPGTRIVRTQGESQPSRLGTFVVDVIADGGHSWYKVSSMTNKRLLFDLAKEAIYVGDSDEEDNQASLQDDMDIPLFKLARTLASTAKGHRIQTKSPKAFLVLPRIKEHEDPVVDKVLDACRQLGVDLLCSDDFSRAPPLSEKLLHRMAPSPKANFSEVLNIDTSLLVALASDFSHTSVSKQAWFSHSHNDHADLENEQPMISLVYPILSNHKLVCTGEARDTFLHIADMLATESERARALLMLCHTGIEKSQEQRVQELKLLSIHDVPTCLQLPITVVDMNENGCQDRFTGPIKEKLRSMMNPGRSVFSYGWASGRTTLTCNSVIIKQLEKDLEQLPTLGDLPWPSIWAFPTSRPFVGIPKGTGKRVRKHTGDCRANCTCGMDELDGGLNNVTILSDVTK